jgi:D-glycero-alpha-D-manno-heptose-7-phosphate kinase
MLIARAPVRISLGGGGSDLEAYYGRYGGCVISATIDKYFYVFLNVMEDEDLQITSSDYRTFYRHGNNHALVTDGDLALPKAILNEFGIQKGVSIFLASQIPPGTGLGSSSAVAVATIKAIATVCGLSLSKHQIADLACRVEIDKLGMPIGKQDQYAAAFGGLNFFTFTSERVGVEPVAVEPETRRELNQNLMLFFTGSSRDSAKILKEQKGSSENDDPEVIGALHAVKEMALEVKARLEQGDLTRFGQLLDLNWQRKKRFASGITNPLIDECYSVALANGALGGKITGAGGGGFLMLYCEPGHQGVVTSALEARGLRRMDFRFETDGARVLLNAGLRLPQEDFAGLGASTMAHLGGA